MGRRHEPSGFEISSFFDQILGFQTFPAVIYTVFDEESDFQVENSQIQRPEAKNKEKRH